MMPTFIHRSTYLLAGVTLAYIGLLIAAPHFMTPEYCDWFFSSEGPHELTSIALWTFTAGVTTRYLPYDRTKALLFTTLFAFFAMREAGLQKAFTSGTFIKLKFYTQGMGTEQWIALPFALAFVAVLATGGVVILRYLLRGGWRDAGGQAIFIAAGTMVVCKVADRLPSVLRKDYGILVDDTTRRALLAIEEGIEAYVPLLFVASLLLVPNLFTRSKLPRP